MDIDMMTGCRMMPPPISRALVALMLLATALTLPQARANAGDEVGRLHIMLSGTVVNNTQCTFASRRADVDFGEMMFRHSAGMLTMASSPVKPLMSPTCTGPDVTVAMFLDGDTVVKGSDTLLKTDNPDLGIQLLVRGTRQNAGRHHSFHIHTDDLPELAVQLVQIHAAGANLKDGGFTASAALHVEFP